VLYKRTDYSEGFRDETKKESYWVAPAVDLSSAEEVSI